MVIFSNTLYAVGHVLALLGILELLPAMFDAAAGNPDWKTFVWSCLLTTGFAGALIFGFGQKNRLEVNRREVYLLTTCLWLFAALIAAMPFYFSSLDISFTDAFFEAASGLTTTGSTVLSGLDDMPPGILVWRALLQWVGGVGIVVVGIAVLPMLQVGGMALFRTESSDHSEKEYPRVAQLAGRVGAIYVLLTLLCTIAYSLLGMSFFDAALHAMTTLSTGGFSTHDRSLGYFNSPAIEWAAALFMLSGALPFVAYIRVLKGAPQMFWRDSQVRSLSLFVVVVSGLIALWLAVVSDISFFTALRQSTFSVISIATTTGFVTVDYTLWGPAAVGAFLLLSLVGGATGSTAGGIKTFRFSILWRAVIRNMKQMIHPNGVFRITYSKRPVSTEVLSSVYLFFTIFVVSFALITLALTIAGLDIVTAISGAATALANVGPGLGEIIGPTGNFASLPDSAKIILSLAMIAGRLELLTALVLFLPMYWRKG